MNALMLVAVLLLLGLALACITVSLLARGILSPPRMNDGKAVYRLRRLSPGDLGLAFENENFTVHDSDTHKPLHIAGWWIPHPGPRDQCVILLHGYADAKVGSIAWAPMFQSLGFNVLAIDLRAHGESGGRFCTAGFFERDDIAQVIDQLTAARPAQSRRVVLFGISLGAAVAAATAAQRDDIAAVVLESPFADFQRAVAAHASLIGLPSGPLLRAALRLSQFISAARFEQVKPTDTIGQTRCPLLAVIGGQDELLSEQDITAIQNAIHQRSAEDRVSEAVVIEAASHLTAMQLDPDRYMQIVKQFLDRALAKPPSAQLNS